LLINGSSVLTVFLSPNSAQAAHPFSRVLTYPQAAEMIGFLDVVPQMHRLLLAVIRFK
jgi:hypothetical protein